MRPSELSGLDAFELSLETVGSDSFETADVDEVVDLRSVDAQAGTLRLVQGPRTYLAAAADRRTRLRLSRLPLADRRIAAWVVADAHRSTIRVWSFTSGALLVDRHVRIRVDDAVLRTIAERQGGAVDAASAIEWLTRAFLLTSPHAGCYSIVGRTSDRRLQPLNRDLSLIGSAGILDVTESSDGLLAHRLAPLRHADPEVAQTVLITARAEFITGISGDPSSDRLPAVLSNASYLARWSRYNEREHDLEQERADELGEAGYRAVQPLGNSYRLLLHRGSESFLTRLSVGLEVSAVGDAPEHLRARELVATGAVEQIGPDWIDFRPLDDRQVLPAQGRVCYALGGSTVSYKRRLVAAQRLATGAIGLPELSALLELRSVPPRRVERRLGWDSPAVRSIFGGDRPTPAQQRAIELALNTPDVAVIQGPPGTGKTKVIAAIAARVAEELGDVTASRQILVSSFQHDAVDNVAARTVVFGLPSIKEGRAERGGSWLQQWRRDRLHRAQELLAGHDLGAVAALRGWIAERRTAYLLSPLPLAAAADLLDEVLGACARYIPSNVVEDGHALASRLRREGRPHARRGQLEAAIRSLRLTADSHADDGPLNATRLRARLEREDVQGLDLSVLSTVVTDDLTPFVSTALAKLKEDLLDRFAVTSVRTLTPPVHRDVADILSTIDAALNERLAAEGHGIALVLQRLVHELESDPARVERALASYAPVVAATCQAAGGLAASIGALQDEARFETVIVDEAARANPLDLQIPMTLATRRVVLVGDQRQLPHIVDDAIATAVSADKAEAEELEESLFGRLFRFLEAERRQGRPDRCVTLTSQFRMHPDLGSFVSRYFYEPHGQQLDSPRPASDFLHGLVGYGSRCAAWEDVPARLGRDQRVGQSRARRCEARQIAVMVRALMEEAPQLTFGIISFYRAQVELILEELTEVGVSEFDTDADGIVLNAAWRFIVNDDGETVERLRVGTVDAFQGKEFDVVFLSMVRTPAANASGPAAAFGHLVVPNRLCVSMSRQRRLLIAVGDRAALTSHPLASEHLAPLIGFAHLADSQL